MTSTVSVPAATDAIEPKTHDVTWLFPMVSDQELDRLAADIGAHGQRDPIELWNGLVIDGRNRVEACRRAGVIPQYRDVEVDDPVAYVLSKNLLRRHLMPSQRAMVAVKLEALYAGEARERQVDAAHGTNAKLGRRHKSVTLPTIVSEPSDAAQRESRTRAAWAVGVNPGYVSRAKRVCAEAPDLAEGVAAGPITLREAEREIDHRNRQRDRDAAPRTTLGNGIEIRLGAFQEVLADIEDGSVALIVADLLWQDEHVGQWDDLGKDGSRLFMPGGILVAYCGWGCLLRAGEFLSRHLTYGWGGALPHRGPNKRVHSVKCIEGTTPMLFYAKGDFRPKEYWRNAVESPRPEKDWHPYQKPLAHVAYYIEKFTNPGDLVVDPSLGGSTTAVACQQGKRRFIGCDIEPDAVAATLQRLHDDSATAS